MLKKLHLEIDRVVELARSSSPSASERPIPRRQGIPLEIAKATVRANAWPIVVLWIVASALVAGYYSVAAFADVLAPIASWQTRWGWKGAFCSCSFFCGIVPYFVYRFGGRARLDRPFRLASAQIFWCGLHGVLCSWFFQLQSFLFGAGHDALTVLMKIVTDQFGWAVLVIVPSNAVFYAVLTGRLRIENAKGAFRDLFWRSYLPGLILNWCFGIPSCLAVYSFPSALQIHVLGLMSACGVIVSAGIGSRFSRTPDC